MHRRALATAAIAAAILVGATAHGQTTKTVSRATATALSSFGDDHGQVVNTSTGTTKRTSLTDYDEDGVQIGSGEATATVRDDGSARSTSIVSDIKLLDGRITIGAVGRIAAMGADGRVHYAGEATAVNVDGQYFQKLHGQQTIQFSHGHLDVNDGSTGLHLVYDDGSDQEDLTIAVARASQHEVSTATPTPTPTATPTSTPTATSTTAPQATSTSAPTATPTKAPKTKAQIQAALVKAAEKRFRHGRWIFPIAAEARVADNYGTPRPAPIQSHEGVDIFAPFGSPVVAVRDGTLSLVGTLPISGNRLWLTTGDGDAFFYAHLSSFAPVAKDGAKVSAGEVLGYAGNTGDAEPTPPHLHFEVHPGGEPKPSVDPYPIVTRWQDAEGGRHTQSTDRPGALVTVKDFLAP